MFIKFNIFVLLSVILLFNIVLCGCSKDKLVSNNNQVLTDKTSEDKETLKDSIKIDPYSEVSANLFSEKSDGIKVTNKDDDKTVISSENNTEWVKYSNVDFGENGAIRFIGSFFITDDCSPEHVKIYIDSNDGTSIGDLYVEIDSSDYTNNYIDSSELNDCVTGVHDVYINIPKNYNMEWFRFSKPIYFDSAYEGNFTGQELADKIQLAISQANKWDVIVFEKPVYDFTGVVGDIYIDKPLLLRGKIPDSNKYQIRVGASDISVKFNNLKKIKIQSSYVHIKHLEINGSGNKESGYNEIIKLSDSTYNKQNLPEFYENLVFNNVKLSNTNALIFAGNGAGVEFKNVSFEDFKYKGYITNRRGRVNEAPKLEFIKCYFKPLISQAYYDTRGIGLDAGNTEYPVVWDHNGSIIEDCIFEDVGLSCSKVGNIEITNNFFICNEKDIDMIHLEEFSKDILIQNNMFRFNSTKNRGRGIYLDREGQLVNNIVIDSNEFIGKYKFLISAYSPRNLTFTYNDLSKAAAKSNVEYGIDFCYMQKELREKFGIDFPTKNLVMKSNIGLDEDSQKKIRINLLENDKSNDIDEFVKDMLEIKIVQKPESLLSKGVDKIICRIKNKSTGGYLAANEIDDRVALIPNKRDDNTDLWEVEFLEPKFYRIKNMATKNYMEVTKGYTLGDLQRNRKLEEYIKQIYRYQDTDAKPIWWLTVNDDDDKYFEISPGANERKSRITYDSTKGMPLIENSRLVPFEQVPPDDYDLWEFVIQTDN